MSLNQTLQELKAKFPLSDTTMPALFIGHGNPMNAIEDNEFSRAWTQVGKELPHPNAILCISAHWETNGTKVTSMQQPKTIHDFGGFPRELFEYQYPAPGSPELAELTCGKVEKTGVCLDTSWGLDHGTWSVLCRLFPNADIPVIQLSLDRTQSPAYHYELGRELRELRDRGVLVIGSGNIVHNLGAAFFQDKAYDWAMEFDEAAKQLIEAGNHAPLVNFQSLGQAARLSIPTSEHYLPLLYTLALQDKNEQLRFFAEGISFGSLSMRSVWIG
jgi:4,5-DOPA dioxygenase extradiol